MKLSDSDLELLKTNPGGIYCIALKDSVWQAKLAKANDPDDSDAYPLVYIGLSGASRGIKNRLGDHLSKLRRGDHDNSHLQRVFDKYGEAALESWVIETCSDDKLNDREAYWIRFFGASERFGFNFTDGGDGARGYKFTDEQRAKLSGENHPRFGKTGENSPSFGKRHTESTREKMSAARKRFFEAPEARAHISGERNPAKRLEVRAKLSAANSGENHPMFGKKHTEEARAKISATLSGKKKSPETIAKRLATIRANKQRKRREMILTNLANIEPTAQSAA